MFVDQSPSEEPFCVGDEEIVSGGLSGVAGLFITGSTWLNLIALRNEDERTVPGAASPGRFMVPGCEGSAVPSEKPTPTGLVEFKIGV
jgi:hypothetical protein